MAHSDKKRLAGKVAIFTGSGRGIGHCEALLMAQQGAKVVVSGIGTDTNGASTAGKVAEEIRAAGGDAISSTENVASLNVNGCSFYVAGEEVGLWSEPELTRSLAGPGGWDLDSLDMFARDSMIGDLTNPFLIKGPLQGNE